MLRWQINLRVYRSSTRLEYSHRYSQVNQYNLPHEHNTENYRFTQENYNIYAIYHTDNYQ